MVEPIHVPAQNDAPSIRATDQGIAHEISVFIACEGVEYAVGASVVIASLLENNTWVSEVVLVVQGLPENVSKHLDAWAAREPKLRLASLPEQFQNVQPHPRLGVMTYCRMFPELFVSRRSGRALYLDADMLVAGDLSELVEIDIDSDLGIAAVIDAQFPFVGLVDHLNDSETAERSSFPYFNAGVLLFDMAQWQATGAQETLLQQIADLDPNRYVYADQDLLNVRFAGGWGVLPFKYNVPVEEALNEWRPRILRAWLGRKTYWQSITSPAIWHFAGGSKPWLHSAPATPALDLWRSYLSLTPFIGYRPKKSLRSYRDLSIRWISTHGKAWVRRSR